MSAPFLIHLPQFEGPFDLLLFFIERDELSINDIPIYKITNDFLDYIQHLERLNIEVASEFILVAATLMRIKAKMLLPRKDLDDAGNEIDPREELVQALLEYKRFKEIVEILKQFEDHRALKYSRGNQKNEVEQLVKLLADDAELETVTLFRLLKAYQRSMDKYKTKNEKIVHTVSPFKYSIEEEKDRLASFIKLKTKASFEEIFTTCESKIQAVFIFLGMLELIQQQIISIIIGEGSNNFWLTTDVVEY
ncbi:MAG: segregation/condensation protein A [Chitinophagales bacterium]|nr:segregation/condensation protein A [Chitinophagales bacterium]HMY22816.1 segregation/condensation protein A [Chitinophagales bacterium]HMZ34260.1 segregation/condensation protein A [Chitinophagales bacterium]HNB47888.1 segregation/condensation protein A [Chitinophagales bacterium]HNF18618.1 segregation/condensation protein A [Chitinophagales bacterium]